MTTSIPANSDVGRRARALAAEIGEHIDINFAIDRDGIDRLALAIAAEHQVRDREWKRLLEIGDYHGALYGKPEAFHIVSSASCDLCREAREIRYRLALS